MVVLLVLVMVKRVDPESGEGWIERAVLLGGAGDC